MKSFIKMTMEQRGIMISEEELTDLTSRWQSLTEMKDKLLENPPRVTEIAIQNIPRSDKRD